MSSVKRLLGKSWVVGLLGLLAGAAAVALILAPQLTDRGDELAASQDQVEELEDDRGSLSKEVALLERDVETARKEAEEALSDDREAFADEQREAEEDLAAREDRVNAQLDQRSADLDARAAELTEAEQTLESTTIPSGVWELGRDFEAGTYRAPGGPGCYWEKLSAPSGKFGDIIANGGFGKNQTLTIDSPYFSTEGCGDWVKIG
ncbi:hypothetical protein HJD18_12380 [Thermoleophilia bacterium SCSIO 60948]|nr:hypothetical protein HJD18_12380 [Thermoleophilia bacterium SCSIO 60948]